DDGVRNIRNGASAPTEHSSRDDPGIESDAGDPGAVVCACCDSAGRMRSVPRTRRPAPIVSWVLCIGVAAVAVVRGPGVAYEIVSADDVRDEVWMRPVSRIKHSDRDSGTGRQVPCIRQVDAADTFE